MAVLEATPTLDDAQRLLRERDWQGAARLADKLWRQQPNSAPALRLLCEALQTGNRNAQVCELLEPLIRQGLKDARLLFRYAASRAATGDQKLAARFYKRVVDLEPSYVEAWLNLGVCLKNVGQAADAVVAYRKAIALKPDLPEAHNNLGLALQQAGDHEAAIAALTEAVRLRPGYARAHANLAQSLLKLDRIPEAEAHCRTAIAAEPQQVDGYINLGLVLLAQNRQHETAEVFRQVLRLQPDDPKALSNLGVALKEIGAIDEAVEMQIRAQAVSPDDPTPPWNEPHVRLLTGDLAVGWERYERRWGTGDFKTSVRPFKAPLWRGEGVGNRALLVHLEQGVGDTVQFCRSLPILAERFPGAELTLEVQLSLLGLIRHSFRRWPRILVLPHANIAGVNLPPFELQLPLATLPRAFGTRLDTIPAMPSYIEPPRIRDYRQPGDQLVIGLSWKSVGATGRKRSLALERLARLLARPGVRLVDLQYGDTQGERAALERDHGIALVHDATVDAKADLGAFAEQVKGCDLVVSIDNTTVHIAGALGVPCWVLLPYVPDWRWLLRREDSPWYPSLKLYRPPALHAWDPLLERLGDDLAAVLAGDHTRLQPQRWDGPPALSP